MTSGWSSAVPTARFLGTRLRALAGGSEVPLEGESVGELLQALVTKAGPTMDALLFSEGTLARDARILKNGRNVALLDGLETALDERDTVTVYFFGNRSYPGG